MNDKMIWWNPNIFLMSVICAVLNYIQSDIWMGFYTLVSVYFACLAIWNMKESNHVRNHGA